MKTAEQSQKLMKLIADALQMHVNARVYANEFICIHQNAKCFGEATMRLKVFILDKRMQDAERVHLLLRQFKRGTTTNYHIFLAYITRMSVYRPCY